MNKLFHSEVNLLIQHIIVQDQDGLNNNTYDGFDMRKIIENMNTNLFVEASLESTEQK